MTAYWVALVQGFFTSDEQPLDTNFQLLTTTNIDAKDERVAKDGYIEEPMIFHFKLYNAMGSFLV